MVGRVATIASIAQTAIVLIYYSVKAPGWCQKAVFNDIMLIPADNRVAMA